MKFALQLLIILLFACLNRARGTQLFGLTTSTEAGRLVSMYGMAMLVAFLAFLSSETDTHALMTFIVSFAGLLLWCTFGWDNYWSAAIGNPTDITKPTFAPVDWIMSKLPAMPLRLWGAIAMGLRQSLATPTIAAIACIAGHPEHAIYGLATLFFGFIYMATGYGPNRYAIPIAEPFVGATLGFLFTQAII